MALQFEKVNEVEVEIPYIPRPEFERVSQSHAALRQDRRASPLWKDRRMHQRPDPARAAEHTREPSPRYAYIGPTFVQVKDVAWSYVKHYTALLPGLQIVRRRAVGQADQRRAD